MSDCCFSQYSWIMRVHLPILIALSFCWPSAAVLAQDSPWGWGTMTLDDYGKVRDMGMTLFTKAKNRQGAAFRCDRKRLYAFIAVKPVDMHAMMLRRSSTAKPWAVSYRINGGEAVDEQWVAIHGGRMLMVKSAATARKLFDAARYGANVSIEPRYGKDIDVEIPADTISLFEKFAERCGIEKPLERPIEPV